MLYHLHWAILFALGWVISALVWPLYHNWMRAKQLQVPLILSPIDQEGRVWRFIRGFISDHHLDWLSNHLGFLRVTSPDWSFQRKYTTSKQYGDIFALVSPSGIKLFIADIEASREFLSRGADFPKPIEIIKKIDLFGSSLASVEGQAWKRHRRATAAAFSDNINETVWTHSFSKASTLLGDFLLHDAVSDTKAKLIQLSFSVLMKACLGVDGEDIRSSKGLDVSLAERHLTQLLRMMSTKITPRKIISGLMTSQPNLFDQSIQGLKTIFAQLIAQERDYPSPVNNVLSSMIALGDQSLLSTDEIQGNLFLLMFAGHETTANTLLYAVYLLAIFPEWQTWATKELDHVLSDFDPSIPPPMQELLHRVPRLRAIMYETLRLYSPVATILRKTPDNPQQITISSGRTLSIPGNMRINILTAAFQADPDIWGSDSLVWSPSRWMDQETRDGAESIDTNKLDSLFAWAKGLRACPGKKFSECEMLAVLVTFLRSSFVQIVPQDGKSPEDARLEALEVVNRSRVRLTLQMDQPEAVHLRWSPR